MNAIAAVIEEAKNELLNLSRKCEQLRSEAEYQRGKKEQWFAEHNAVERERDTLRDALELIADRVGELRKGCTAHNTDDWSELWELEDVANSALGKAA